MAAKTTGFTTVYSDGTYSHAHAYDIDEFGNGYTKGLVGGGSPHVHTISAKKVSPSGFDNHTHKLASGRPTKDDLST